MENKNKTAYFQWLRLLAAAAVVLMHTAAKGWNAAGPSRPEWTVLTCWDGLVRWPVPVFVMITGALFLPRRTPWKTILTRYIPRMALCFGLWSGLYVLYQLRTDPAAELWQLFAAGQYHLWYLPFLCGVYLTLPFLQKICEDDRLAGQLTVLSLVFGCAVPWGMDLLALLWPDRAAVFSSVRGHLNYAFFLDLLGAVMLGHRLHSRDLSRRQRLSLYGLGLGSLAVTIAATLHFSTALGRNVTLFFEHSSPMNLCTAAAVFVFARYNLTRLPKPVGRMADRSFGIYLSHALVIEVLTDRGIHVLAWDPVWSVPVLTAAVFAIALAISAVLGKIPVIGKYLA